jgi:hypothetical protein
MTRTEGCSVSGWQPFGMTHSIGGQFEYPYNSWMLYSKYSYDLKEHIFSLRVSSDQVCESKLVLGCSSLLVAVIVPLMNGNLTLHLQ